MVPFLPSSSNRGCLINLRVGGGWCRASKLFPGLGGRAGASRPPAWCRAGGGHVITLFCSLAPRMTPLRATHSTGDISRLRLPQPGVGRGGVLPWQQPPLHCTTLQQRLALHPGNQPGPRGPQPEARSKNNPSCHSCNVPTTGPAPVPGKCHGKSSPRIRLLTGSNPAGSAQEWENVLGTGPWLRLAQAGTITGIKPRVIPSYQNPTVMLNTQSG